MCVCVCLDDRQNVYVWHGMVWYSIPAYIVWVLVSLFEKCMAVGAYGGYSCSGSSKKMDGIHIYKMLVHLSLYRTMPSPRQRQTHKHRNILDGGSYERCTHIQIYTIMYTYSHHITQCETIQNLFGDFFVLFDEHLENVHSDRSQTLRTKIFSCSS